MSRKRKEKIEVSLYCLDTLIAGIKRHSLSPSEGKAAARGIDSCTEGGDKASVIPSEGGRMGVIFVGPGDEGVSCVSVIARKKGGMASMFVKRSEGRDLAFVSISPSNKGVAFLPVSPKDLVA